MTDVAKPCSTIEIRHLCYFVAAAEHGSFRKAGVALGIRSSAISRRIRDLEDRLGASLFQRYSGGVHLTFAGQRFLPRVRKIIRDLGEGAKDIAQVGRSEQGCIRIGIYSSLASGFLTELLRGYGDRYGDVRVELVDGNPDEHVAAIRQLHLDVAFLTGSLDWSDCTRVHLWSERVFVALPEQNYLVMRDAVTWQDLAEETFIVSEAAPGQEIHDHLVREITGLGLHLEVRVQSVGRDNLLSLVAIGQGLTLVSEAMTATQFPGVVYRPILGEVLPFSAVWLPRNDNPAFRRLLSLAKAMAATPSPPKIELPDAPSQIRDPSP